MKYNRVVCFDSGRLYIGEGFQSIGNVNDIIDMYNDVLRDLESRNLNGGYNFCVGFFHNGDFVLFLYGDKVSIVSYKTKRVDESTISYKVNILPDDAERNEVMKTETRNKKVPEYPHEWKMIIIKDELHPSLRQNLN
ncbi:MAG: hypothetical protein QXM68_03830 [Candidatus Aenigmatarchaeota archaeon]|nr:hypothetical protein [Candidatus Aenigmarchaeota archaeon]